MYFLEDLYLYWVWFVACGIGSFEGKLRVCVSVLDVLGCLSDIHVDPFEGKLTI